MVHTPLNDCCNDCRNGVLITRLSDKLNAMAIRTIDLENALRNCLEELEYAQAARPDKDYSPSITLAKVILENKK